MEQEEERPAGEAADVRSDVSAESENLCVVGVGASAGGLEALEQLFDAVPPDTGAAYVVIQHLSPTHKSMMAELLSSHTRMPVKIASDGEQLRPNHVYLVPPAHNITCYHQRLYLTDQHRGIVNYPIDRFFESLAEDQGEMAAVVILSGTGSDGTKGLRSVKEKGGLVVVQTPESARFDGMPRSALATNLVDQALPPDGIAELLARFIREPGYGLLNENASVAEEGTLYKVLALLRKSSGIDFAAYKPTTVMRRIEHRMGLGQIRTLDELLGRLETSQAELDALFHELLIGVTRFFRDPKAFETLDREVLAPLVEQALERPMPTVRVWVPGCSTGEEVYTLAMLLNERLRRQDRYVEVKIFATDVDVRALNVASHGLYPDGVLTDVPPDLAQRYFRRQGEQFQASRELRQMIVFAPHNILKDPPFSKVDLISCRNLLIYFNADAQARAFEHFIYALASDGYLFLGRSESLAEQMAYFDVIDGREKIFRKQGGHAPRLMDSMARRSLRSPRTTWRRERVQREEEGLTALFERRLAAHLPPSFIVDDSRQVTHMFGAIEPYLTVPLGRTSYSVDKILHPDLVVPLGTALHRLSKGEERAEYARLPLSGVDGVTRVRMSVEAVGTAQGGRTSLVVIRPETNAPIFVPGDDDSHEVEEQTKLRILDLESQLRHNEESLQAAIEELETSNEELQATNEELMASNEELQSTNEELQSTNEELLTVNAELQARVRELTQLNADLDSLLENLEVGILFLDQDLHIRKFTNSIQFLINLTRQDMGRPVYHFSHVLKDVDIKAVAQATMDRGVPYEERVQSVQGNWYLMQLYPYTSLQQLFSGVVLIFFDITDLHQAYADVEAEVEQRKEAEAALRRSQASLSRAQRVAHLGSWEMDIATGVSSWSDEFYRICGYEPGSIEPTSEVGMTLIHPDDRDRAAEAVSLAIEEKRPYAIRKRIVRPNGTVRHVLSQGEVEMDEAGTPVRMAGSFLDITEQVEAEVQLKQSQERLRFAAEVTAAGVFTHHQAGSSQPYLSRRAAALLGFEDDEAPAGDGGMEWLYDRIHPEDREAFEAGYRAFLESTAGAFDAVARMRSRAGSWHRIRTAARAVTSGTEDQASRIVGVLLDLSATEDVG